MSAVTFQATAEDLVAAYRTYFVTSLRSWRVGRIWLIGAVIFAGAAQVFAWGDGWLAAAAWAAGGAAYWSVLLAIIFGINYLLLPRRTRRIYRQQKALHDPVTIEWSADGVAITASRGAARFAWTDFHRFATGRRTLLLFQSDALFNFIPVRVLSPAEAADLAGHLRDRAGG